MLIWCHICSRLLSKKVPLYIKINADLMLFLSKLNIILNLGKGKYVPRSIFVDLEPTVIDEVNIFDRFDATLILYTVIYVIQEFHYTNFGILILMALFYHFVWVVLL